MKLKFAPIKFQAALAAGGITLMAYNYLQSSVPYSGQSVRMTDIAWSGLSVGDSAIYGSLTAIMFAFTVLNVVLTIILLKSSVGWFLNKTQFNNFMADQSKNITIFVPIGSLAMTLNVIWGPLTFFTPNLSVQALMLPSIIFFGFLWFSIFALEFKVAKWTFTNSVDFNKFNFVWLLDVFAFGLVGLAGTGIAAISSNSAIVTTAAVSSIFILTIGFFIFLMKFTFLVYSLVKQSKLPDYSVVPAYFLVVPITCLYSLSFYRILGFIEVTYAFDVSAISFLLIAISFVITIGWGSFTVYLLFDYLRNNFHKSTFAPTQWGIV